VRARIIEAHLHATIVIAMCGRGCGAARVCEQDSRCPARATLIPTECIRTRGRQGYMKEGHACRATTVDELLGERLPQPHATVHAGRQPHAALHVTSLRGCRRQALVIGKLDHYRDGVVSRSAPPGLTLAIPLRDGVIQKSFVLY
jgi:hypothetical protein